MAPLRLVQKAIMVWRKSSNRYLYRVNRLDEQGSVVFYVGMDPSLALIETREDFQGSRWQTAHGILRPPLQRRVPDTM